jgi:hypothetical protein
MSIRASYRARCSEDVDTLARTSECVPALKQATDLVGVLSTQVEVVKATKRECSKSVPKSHQIHHSDDIH